MQRTTKWSSQRDENLVGVKGGCQRLGPMEQLVSIFQFLADGLHSDAAGDGKCRPPWMHTGTLPGLGLCRADCNEN